MEKTYTINRDTGYIEGTHVKIENDSNNTPNSTAFITVDGSMIVSDTGIEYGIVYLQMSEVTEVTEVTENSNIEPSHYTDLAISPYDYITANEGEFTWCIGNVIKYVSRYKRKNGLEDLKKARWYLEAQIKMLEEQDES